MVAVTGEVGPSVVCEERVHLSDAGVFRFNVHHVVDQTSANSRSTKELRSANAKFCLDTAERRVIDMNQLCGDHTPKDEFNVNERMR